MGASYYYYCDSCGKVKMVSIAPFEGSDPGENTPMGWKWKYPSGELYCFDCK